AGKGSQSALLPEVLYLHTWRRYSPESAADQRAPAPTAPANHYKVQLPGGQAASQYGPYKRLAKPQKSDLRRPGSGPSVQPSRVAVLQPAGFPVTDLQADTLPGKPVLQHLFHHLPGPFWS